MTYYANSRVYLERFLQSMQTETSGRANARVCPWMCVIHAGRVNR